MWLAKGNHDLTIGLGSRIALLVFCSKLSNWFRARAGLGLDVPMGILAAFVIRSPCKPGSWQAVICTPLLVSGGTLSHKGQPLLSVGQACSPENCKQELDVGWNLSLCGSPVATVVCPHALPRAQLSSDWSGRMAAPLQNPCWLPSPCPVHYFGTSRQPRTVGTAVPIPQRRK